jgi:hypothetical protein
MFSYRSLLKQAFSLAWKNKYLWFFGLFASLTVAGGSWEYQIITQNFGQNLVDSSYYNLSGLLALGDLLKNFFSGFVNLFRFDFLTIINVLTLLLAATVILVLFIWLAIASQAALVDSTKKILTAGKKKIIITIRSGLTAGQRHFWSVFGLNILTKVLISLALFIISLPLLFMVISNASILSAIYIILFVIFIPIGTGLSLMIKYAISYKVLDNQSFIGSLEKSGKLFKENWLVSLEMAVILFLINLLIGGLLLVGMAVFLLPLFLLGLGFNLAWLTILIALVAIVLVILTGSFLTTFQIAAWTGLFLNLKERGGLAKLERLFKH